MSFRQFTDDAGREWSVYDIDPVADDRRTAERRQEPESGGEGDERRLEDRRSGLRASRPVHLRKGWLCFETEGERRRLQPIPEGWDRLADRELVALLQEARVAPRRSTQGSAGVSQR